MSEQPDLVALFYFGFLFVGAIIWLALCMRLDSNLKRFEPNVFEELGRPHLFLNNTPRHTWLLLKFLFTRRYRLLAHAESSRLGAVMHWYLLIYLVLFVTSGFVFVPSSPLRRLLAAL